MINDMLCISVSRGYHHIVDFLLSQNYVDFQDKEKALHEATFNGHLCVIKTLISHGMSLPSTALHLALSSTRLDIARFLLENGAGVVGLDRKGNSPVNYSIPKDRSASEELIDQYAEIIQTLIQNGANPNGGGRNQRPLHQASYWGHLKLVKLLKSLGADINLVYDRGSTFGKWGTFEYANNVSPLHDACKVGDDDVVSFLLDNGAEIDATDSNGDTPMMCAVLTTKMLTAHFHTSTGQMSYSSVGCNNTSVVKILIDRGSRIDTRNKLGETALHLAAGNRNREQFVLLVRAGARLDLTSVKGDDPLMINEGWGRSVCSR